MVRLTQYSHGAGCGCKISPAILDNILSMANGPAVNSPALLVGNEHRDDAAVMDLGDGTALISTTDFFMPVVDDPEDFGRIAAANAISDVYAMGGKPLMAIAILGWPINQLAPEIAGLVIKGGQETCYRAGIPLAGGHSIDAPEPIFGLAVTGKVDIKNLKKNAGAQPGDVLILTKPLGIGVLTTAEKQGKLKDEHQTLAASMMIRLNAAGERLGQIKGVRAMTDVTGFGLAGHLIEMCKASGTSATIMGQQIPLITDQLMAYIDAGCVPGGTNRNFSSYGQHIRMMDETWKPVICDPQTSGGLLIAVAPAEVDDVQRVLKASGDLFHPIGYVTEPGDFLIHIE